MEGEFFEKQDVIRTPLRLKRRELSPWELSLQRIAKAQALLWNRAPVLERMKILAELDREAEGEQK